MKLTCPNCGAQYAVPDEVIPEAGRDVQCSNCGDTWFQAHRDHPLPESEDTSDDWQQSPPAPQPADHDKAEPEKPAPEQPAPEQSGSVETAPPAPDPAQRRGIDPAVASVLREEAERENRARSAAREGLETQPDLGLEDESAQDRRTREVRKRTSHLRGEDTEPPEPQDIDPTSRRGLFPDIDEINSSLAPGNAADTAPETDPYPEVPPARRGGFRRGFLIAVLIAVIALLIYIYAPQLAERFPAARDLLAEYVTSVNGLRAWLDGQIAGLMTWLDGMSSNAPAGDIPGN